MQQGTLVLDFAVVFGVAAITIVLTSKFKLPSILGYLIAGVIVGPYIPIPLFVSSEKVNQISELGVILVMFSIGLEFRLKKLVEILPASGLAALLQILTLFFAGTYLGTLFGCTITESFFLGSAIAISSTMIVKRVFDDMEVSSNAKKFVFGILVIQDLVAILMITVVSSIALGQTLAFNELMMMLGKVLLFILGSFFVGIYIIPRFIHYSFSFRSQELTTIVSCGICFTYAVIAESLGYSVALGAFIAGVLVAESGRSKNIEFNISQLRSIFSAMFFISVGMTIDPRLSFANVELALIVAAVIIFFQLLSVFTAGILSGYGIQTSLVAGLALGQIGEFSFIIVSIGRGIGIISADFHAIVVTAAVFTSITTPLIVKYRDTIQTWFEAILPKHLHALIFIYLSWINNTKFELKNADNPISKNLGRIVLNVFIMIILSSAMSLSAPHVILFVNNVGILPWDAKIIYPIFELLVLFPFVTWAIFCSYHLVHMISGDIWRGRKQKASFYQLLILIILLVILLMFGTIVMLATLPFVNITIFTVFAMLVTMFTFFVLIWKKSHKLQEQMEWGLDRFIKSLRPRDLSHIASTLDVPHNMIPGMDELNMIKIEYDSKAAGKKLSSLNLRALTGATILAIVRDNKSIPLPGGEEIIKINDLIAIVGGEQSILQASKILRES